MEKPARMLEFSAGENPDFLIETIQVLLEPPTVSLTENLVGSFYGVKAIAGNGEVSAGHKRLATYRSIPA